MYTQSHWSMQLTVVSSGSQLLSNNLLFRFTSKNEFILEICKLRHLKEKTFVSWKMKLFCLKSESHLPKKKNYLLDWKPFKHDKKSFLLHLKSSFCSKDIYVFATTFWSCRKNGLIRKIMLTSKFTTSQPGLQTVAIYILPNISQSKANQAMKFAQVTEYNKKNILCQKWGMETSSRPRYFLKKLSMRWK